MGCRIGEPSLFPESWENLGSRHLGIFHRQEHGFCGFVSMELAWFRRRMRQNSLFSWGSPLHCNLQRWGCWTDCVTHRAWRWRHRELCCWAKGTDVTLWLQHLCAVIFLTPVPGRALFSLWKSRGSGLLLKNGLWRLPHSPTCLPSGPFSVERSRVVRLSILEEVLFFFRVHSPLLLLPLLDSPRWQRTFTINNCMWNLEGKDSERKGTSWRLMGGTTVCTFCVVLDRRLCTFVVLWKYRSLL